jgi:enoyl-[acyl-carrier protein] reductase/trans-2-enoyl-CoA reductase (NAD+)
MTKPPRVMGGVCLSVNPKGCMASVRKWIEDEKKKPVLTSGPTSVLILGCSGGYGLAARVVSAFGAGAQTFGVSFERAPTLKRRGTPGWYNNLAFDAVAAESGLFSETLVADAFLDATRETVIARARERHIPHFDLVVYSLAAPQRTDPATGITYRSVIKPTGQPLSGQTLDVASGALSEVTLEPATPEEVEATVKVMGGEDWLLWARALKDAGLLAEGARTVAFSYIGPTSTYAIYRSGSLGKAKEHLENTAAEINRLLEPLHGRAFVSVNKALVTRASAVIPIMSVYVAAMYKVMKAKGLHEGCLEQIGRLFRGRLYAGGEVPVDGAGRIRIDDWELRADVQAEIEGLLARVTPETLAELTDTVGCRNDLMGLYGF